MIELMREHPWMTFILALACLQAIYSVLQVVALSTMDRSNDE